MARPKIEPDKVKSVYMKFRVTPTTKKEFEFVCRKNKISSANRLREFVQQELS
jgi:hypothetical protein